MDSTRSLRGVAITLRDDFNYLGGSDDDAELPVSEPRAPPPKRGRHAAHTPRRGFVVNPDQVAHPSAPDIAKAHVNYQDRVDKSKDKHEMAYTLKPQPPSEPFAVGVIGFADFSSNENFVTSAELAAHDTVAASYCTPNTVRHKRMQVRAIVSRCIGVRYALKLARSSWSARRVLGSLCRSPRATASRCLPKRRAAMWRSMCSYKSTRTMSTALCRTLPREGFRAQLRRVAQRSNPSCCTCSKRPSTAVLSNTNGQGQRLYTTTSSWGWCGLGRWRAARTCMSS